MSREIREVGIAIQHLREWVQSAKLGDKRVLLRLPLKGWDRDILARARELGLVYQDRDRYMLERIF